MSRSRRAGSARPRKLPTRIPARMVARIVSIGDELVLGRTVDTNATWIARWMTDRGFAVDLCQAVGDGQAEIVGALRRAVAGGPGEGGASLIVCTGGLGPTDDDRTRHALAEFLGSELVEHQPSWKRIRAWFERSRRGPIPESNRRQALLPAGARPIVNHRGTAPGMLARAHGCAIACLPGVPHEMMRMLEEFTPRVPKLFPALAPPAIAEIWFAGIGESTAQGMIGDLLSECDPQVGITVSELGHITLRIVGLERQVEARHRQLARLLSAHALPAAGLAPSLVAELARLKRTVSAAESCTCGHVAALIGSVPGASRVLRESIVAYHEDVKRARLGVSAELLAREGAVSEACARAMAEGARHRTEADLAVATTGIAGPDGGTATDPVGTVWVAVADARGSVARRHVIVGNRERVQRRGATYALQLAWERLAGKA